MDGKDFSMIPFRIVEILHEFSIFIRNLEGKCKSCDM